MRIFFHRSILLMVGIIWFFGACQQPTDSSDASGNETTNAPPVAHVSLSQTVPVGDSVQVDGRNSSDPDGDQLTYQWTLAAVPSRSSARLTNTETPVTTFRADVLGEYVVELTVSDGEADSSRTGTITAVADQAPQLGNITTDTVLENRVVNPALPDYRAPETVEVMANLTIEPGVKIVFGPEAMLFVRAAGSIHAVGRPDSVILLTGEQAVPGYWGGLELFGSDSPDNHLKYVHIEYGGGVNADQRQEDQRANLLLNDFYEPVRVRVDHCTFQHSAVNGIYVGGERAGVTVEAFTGNTMTDNAAPGYIAVNTLGDVTEDVRFYGEPLGRLPVGQADANDYTGNGTDILTIYGTAIDSNQSWQDPGVPLKILNPIVIQGDSTAQATLRLGAGIELRFTAGTGIQVREYGAIDLQGSTARKILLTGTGEQPGSWNGVEIFGSGADNLFWHTIIEYGGGGDADQRGPLHRANLMLNDFYEPVRAKLVDVTLRNSAANGLYVGGDRQGVSLTGFRDVTATDNAYPALVHINQLGQLDENVSFYNNTTNVVRVYGNRVDSTQTWPAVNAPYRFRESVMVNGTDTDSISLWIQPGASFQFAEDTQLTIGEYAALVAEGTISRPITFTGAEQTPGYWGGIEFFGSVYAINSLHHVNIAYGGGVDIDERSGTAANLLLNDFYDPVQLTISNSLVGYSANYGIYVGGDREGLTVNCQGLTYLENAGGPTGGEGTLDCDGG